MSVGNWKETDFFTIEVIRLIVHIQIFDKIWVPCHFSRSCKCPLCYLHPKEQFLVAGDKELDYATTKFYLAERGWDVNLIFKKGFLMKFDVSSSALTVKITSLEPQIKQLVIIRALFNARTLQHQHKCDVGEKSSSFYLIFKGFTICTLTHDSV